MFFNQELISLDQAEKNHQYRLQELNDQIN